MRKILFRGRRIKDGKWLYGYYFVDRGEHFIVKDEKVNPFTLPEDFIIDPASLGRFVGLLDCKQRPIYEGDIVRTDVAACNFADGAMGEVTFLRIVSYNDYAAFEPFSEFKYERHDWEVIGNIHP